MEQAVSRREKVKIITAPTYDDSRAKITLWNDPLVVFLLRLTTLENVLNQTTFCHILLYKFLKYKYESKSFNTATSLTTFVELLFQSR